MDATHAELSSAATTLDDLSDRVERMADRLQAERHETLAADLYEVERALRMAQRRLARARGLRG
jgi:hypothetical protein